MPGLKALAHMDTDQVLNQMSREQLVSLLYEILRRLLAPAQPTHPADVSCHVMPKQDEQLVIDPTIDAWEHTGIYPQGYNPPPTREGGRAEDEHTRVGHVLHICRTCIDQRPVGEPRSGA